VRLRKLAALLVAGLAAVSLFGATASAIDLFPSSVCNGSTNSSAACSGNGTDTISGANGVIARATKAVSIVGGIAAVFAILIGGFLMMTAAGDSGKLNSGRQTVIYALIGVVIIALARTIILFVVTRV
jgi:hypothetical protein